MRISTLIFLGAGAYLLTNLNKSKTKKTSSIKKEEIPKKEKEEEIPKKEEKPIEINKGFIISEDCKTIKITDDKIASSWAREIGKDYAENNADFNFDIILGKCSMNDLDVTLENYTTVYFLVKEMAVGYLDVKDNLDIVWLITRLYQYLINLFDSSKVKQFIKLILIPPSLKEGNGILVENCNLTITDFVKANEFFYALGKASEVAHQVFKENELSKKELLDLDLETIVHIIFGNCSEEDIEINNYQQLYLLRRTFMKSLFVSGKIDKDTINEKLNDIIKEYMEAGISIEGLPQTIEE